MKKILSIFIMVLAIGLMFIMPATKELIFCSKKVNATTSANTTPSVKETLELKAKSSILVDAKTGKVLFEDNSNLKLAPASMTKVITLLLVMEEVEKGSLSLNQEVTISEYAASQEGSECFLDAGKNYTILELVKSVAVASANDSCVALAEAVCGDEKLFVNKMNEKAKELNMQNTHFVNCTGLDEEQHYSTAEDLTKAIKALSRFELIAQLEKTWMYDMEHANGRVTGLTNTNRLVRNNADCYMAKTGHTDNAGYCIVVYGKRGGMDLIACVMGLSESADRFNEVTKLLNYGFSNFESQKLISSETSLGEIKVTGGKQNSVKYSVQGDVFELAKKGEHVNYTTNIILNSDVIKAPITKGDIVGSVEVMVGDNCIEKCNLVAQENVDAKSYKDLVMQLLSSKSVLNFN